jgi:hypothetical protein
MSKILNCLCVVLLVITSFELLNMIEKIRLLENEMNTLHRVQDTQIIRVAEAIHLSNINKN